MEPDKNQPSISTQAVVGLCPFSYLAIEGWQKTGEDQESAIKYLFNEKRLEWRFQLFESICLPSLLAQTDTDYTFLILTSSYLPQKYKDRLLDVTSNASNIEVHFREPVKKLEIFQELYESAFSEAEIRASFRLDDDDGLASDFIARIKNNIRPESAPYFITFGQGLTLAFADRKIQYGALSQFPFFSAGLTLVARRNHKFNVFSFPHESAYAHLNTSVLSYGPGWVRSIHDDNDSGGRLIGASERSTMRVEDALQKYSAQFGYLNAHLSQMHN